MISFRFLDEALVEYTRALRWYDMHSSVAPDFVEAVEQASNEFVRILGLGRGGLSFPEWSYAGMSSDGSRT